MPVTMHLGFVGYVYFFQQLMTRINVLVHSLLCFLVSSFLSFSPSPPSFLPCNDLFPYIFPTYPQLSHLIFFPGFGF